MCTCVEIDGFCKQLRLIGRKITDESNTAVRGRILALYSAAIAISDRRALDEAIHLGTIFKIQRELLYEIVLQSYLFLGFPRMLEAADHLSERLPGMSNGSMLKPVDRQESSDWFERGLKLCQKVYSDNYDLLKNRVETFAPEIFRWMVIEGYGKVLSRPGLDVIERELAVIACLMVENRERQLHSHIRGAINVGAAPDMIRQVIEDIGPTVGQGYEVSKTILGKIGQS
jgi:4-carboxymuconolactone decarboxylase